MHQKVFGGRLHPDPMAVRPTVLPTQSVGDLLNEFRGGDPKRDWDREGTD